MLGHDWQPAEGTCIDESWEGGQKWIMDVYPANGAPSFRVEVPHPGLGGDFRGPMRGHTCKMLCDVKKQKAKFDTSDPSLSRRAQLRSRAQELQAELGAAPGTMPGQPAVTVFQVGPTSHHAISPADAAPLLDAILSGDIQGRRAAIEALKQARRDRAGAGPAPFSAQGQPAPFAQPEQGPFSSQSASGPFCAQPSSAPYSSTSTPQPAAFGSQPQPAPFGAPFQGEEAALQPVGDPAERLARLQALHDQGLVTYAEFQIQRQRIIESL
jgi:hypothetical protein